MDETIKNNLNASLIISLYKMLYKDNEITEKEYKELIKKVYRTFNIKK